MLVFVINRILQAIGVLAVMSVLVFVGIYLIGDPTSMLVSAEATELERDAVRGALGLDRPVWVQYFSFVGNAVQGDFGRSFLTGQPALHLILERMPATFELVIVAMGFAVLVGVPLGIIAGLRPAAPLSRGIMAFSILGFSLPTFWIGLMMIMLFAVHLGLLPASGRGAAVTVGPLELSLLTLDGWRHVALPALTLGLAKAALLIRVTRAATREVLPLDYIKFARAKGLPNRRILGVHLLKNMAVGIPSPDERLQAYPYELSGGMRQRIAIAIALINRPRLIIADEPTRALDVSIQGQIIHEVKKLCRSSGTALIWITHDLAVVAGLADRIAVMYAGRLVEAGTTAEVIRTPRHPYTRGLIDSVPSRATRGRRLHQIPGMTPSLLSLPAGCAFRARCFAATDACATAPDQSGPLAGHRYRCWNPLGDTA